MLFIEVGANAFGTAGAYLGAFSASLGRVALSSGFYLRYAAQYFGESLGVHLIYNNLKLVITTCYQLLKLILPIALIVPFLYDDKKSEACVKEGYQSLRKSLIFLWNNILFPLLVIITVVPLFVEDNRYRQRISATLGETVCKTIITPVLSIIWILMTLCMAVGLSALAPEDSPLWQYAVNACYTVVTYTPSAKDTAKRLSKNLLHSTALLLVFIGVITIIPALGYCLYNKFFNKDNKKLVTSKSTDKETKLIWKEIAKALVVISIFTALISITIAAAILVNPLIAIAVYAITALATFVCMQKENIDKNTKSNSAFAATKKVLYSLIPWFGITSAINNKSEVKEEELIVDECSKEDAIPKKKDNETSFEFSDTMKAADVYACCQSEK